VRVGGAAVGGGCAHRRSDLAAGVSCGLPAWLPQDTRSPGGREVRALRLFNPIGTGWGGVMRRRCGHHLRV
jgi:hypothetical protein